MMIITLGIVFMSSSFTGKLYLDRTYSFGLNWSYRNNNYALAWSGLSYQKWLHASDPFI